MRTEIKKWGNSAVVRLPAALLAELDLGVGSPVELTHRKGRLIIEARRRPREGWFEPRPGQERGAFDSIPPDEGSEDWQW